VINPFDPPIHSIWLPHPKSKNDKIRPWAQQNRVRSGRKDQ